MDPGPFQLLFITGVLPTILSAHLRGYRLIQDEKNFDGAWAYCEEHFISMAVVDSVEELAEITAVAQRLGFKSEAWIGMYNDVNSWHWSIDSSLLGSMRKWGAGEPNNNNVLEECVKIDKNGNWFDAPCTDPNPFLCYDAPININESELQHCHLGIIANGPPHYVYISSSWMPWKNAQAYCREHYTDLACPKNESENAAAQAVLASKSVWMGLSRNSWTWADGSAVSFTAWKSSQPDNSGGKENVCTFLSGGKFSDDVCSAQRAFFCQYSLKKMLVKVEIQSNQDVNNPAVKDAIMQKMQDKLKEQGMAESTVLTWRTQPDGKVFYVKNKKENSSETCDV